MCGPAAIALLWCFGAGAAAAQQAPSEPPPQPQSTTEPAPAGEADAPDIFNLELDELKKLTVVGASKVEQKTTDAPASITIVTADEVKKYGHRTLADILRSVSGFHVSYDRNYSFLGVRGVNRGDANSRMLVLVDGHRMNHNLSDGGFIGTEFPIDVDLIDAVEIIRGPSAVLYGNNAFFGVINVRTKRGDAFSGVETSAEAGSYSTYDGRLTYGKQFANGIELVLSGTYGQSDGPERLYYREFDDPATNHGVAQDMDDQRTGQAFGRISWKGLTLQGAFSRRSKTDPTAPFFTSFNDPRMERTEQRGYLSLDYTADIAEDLEFSGNAYYDYYDFEMGLPVTGAPLNKEQQVGEWWGFETRLTKRVADKHTFTAGAEYRSDFRQDRLNYDEDPYVVYADIQRNTRANGVYFQSDVQVLKPLLLSAGVRYDQYDDVDATVNPRLALIYHPDEASAIKAIYGTAFRAPNFFERLLQSPTAPLEPETIETLELVWEQQWDARLRSSVSGFYNQIQDLISLQSDPFGGLSYQNASGAEVLGTEVALDASWADGWSGRASYTFQDAEDRQTDLRLADSPQHLVKLNLIAPAWEDKLFAGLELQYVAERATAQGQRVDDFVLLNLTLFSQNVIKNLEASLSLYNILDQEYSDPATPFHAQDAIEQDGISVRFKLTYRF
jgi:iron complex outermembrane receptor protein